MRLASISDLQQSKETLNDLMQKAEMLSQIYDDFVEEDEGDGHLRAPGIHASELKCERQMTYTTRGEVGIRKITKFWRQRFAMGKALHRMIQDDFHEMARKSNGMIAFEEEVVIGPDHQAIARQYNLRSSADGIFTFFDLQAQPLLRIGLEIKSEAPDGYEKLKGPKLDHIEQAHLYMKALDLPLMYFMYFNKANQNNTPSIDPFLIQFKPEIWDAIEAKCKRVLLAVASNTLPDRKEGIWCDFCAYGHICQPSRGKNRPTGSAHWKQPRSG